MSLQVNVGGIYNLEILNSAIQSGVCDFSFDLRPSSFNFVQEYVLLELLEYISLRGKNIYLHFEGEADFVIEKILKDTKQVMASMGQLNLIFSDNNSADYYEQFGLPYYLVVKSDKMDPKLNESKHLKGLVFPLDVIESLGVPKCLKMIGAAKNFDSERVISCEIKYNQTEIVDTVEDIPSDKLFYTIGPNLELGYRQVDVHRIQKHLNSLKS